MGNNKSAFVPPRNGNGCLLGWLDRFRRWFWAAEEVLVKFSTDIANKWRMGRRNNDKYYNRN